MPSAVSSVLIRSALIRFAALLVLAAVLSVTARTVLSGPALGAGVDWPASTGLVIGEVVTRAAAASDQYAELYNASQEAIDLAGLELDYVTASGATTTVKQAWTGLSMPAGAHLLLANAAGAFAPIADGTFSGGFSTVGGTLVLRNSLGGEVVDALSWGSAASAFVEGTPGLAPPTGSSLERLPGAGDNWLDTNDNAIDTAVQPAPLAQNLSSPVQPAPVASATPTAASCATAPPGATPVPGPASPSPATSPTVTPAPTNVATPSPTSDPTISIAQARVQPIGASVAVQGTVTVDPGWILGDSTLALEDGSGGIYVNLPAMPSEDLAPGDIIRVAGVLAAPYGNLEIRPPDANPEILGHAPPVAPLDLEAAGLGESTEGLLARLEGTVASVSASSSGSLTVLLTDQSGDGRIFVYDTLGLTASDFVRGEHLAVTGLVGDRLGLYRLWPRTSADIVHLGGGATPTPAPTATPSRASAQPSQTATSVVSIAAALRQVGSTVTVEGTVTVRTGLLDADGRRVTMQDSTGAVLVRLPDNETTAVGDRIRVTGAVGTYYGAPQLAADSVTGLSTSALSPLAVRSAPISEALEWRLVTVSGEITALSRDGDSWRAELSLDGGSLPVSGLARSGIPATALEEGRTATITGIVKRAYPTASDQRFSVVPRSPNDITLGAAVSPRTSPPASRPPDGQARVNHRGCGSGQLHWPACAQWRGARGS